MPVELETEMSTVSDISAVSDIAAPDMTAAQTQPPTAESLDGREARSRRTRAAIVEAWLDVVEGGNVSPTAREIADQAGIGLRTVFQHFGDMEDLHAAAAALHFERVAPFVRFEPVGEFPERLAQFCVHRKRLFERITPVRRAALHRAMLAPHIGVLLSGADEVFASIIWAAFAPELAACAPGEAAVLRHSAAAALSWTGWDYLRTSAALAPNDAQAVFQLTCGRLFSPATAV